MLVILFLSLFTSQIIILYENRATYNYIVNYLHAKCMEKEKYINPSSILHCSSFCELYIFHLHHLNNSIPTLDDP